jgi:tetratricopeptide (TPR) repeat protein
MKIATWIFLGSVTLVLGTVPAQAYDARDTCMSKDENIPTATKIEACKLLSEAKSQGLECLNGRTPDTTIAACSSFLSRGGDVSESSASAYRSRGAAYIDKGEYDLAIADFDHSIKLDPKSSATYNIRGNAYFAKRDFDRAIANYDQAIGLDPKYATAYNNRGKAWSAKGEADLARADYAAAIRLGER